MKPNVVDVIREILGQCGEGEEIETGGDSSLQLFLPSGAGEVLTAGPRSKLAGDALD